jgi:hypothetical protein
MSISLVRLILGMGSDRYYDEAGEKHLRPKTYDECIERLNEDLDARQELANFFGSCVPVPGASGALENALNDFAEERFQHEVREQCNPLLRAEKNRLSNVCRISGPTDFSWKCPIGCTTKARTQSTHRRSKPLEGNIMHVKEQQRAFGTTEGVENRRGQKATSGLDSSRLLARGCGLPEERRKGSLVDFGRVADFSMPHVFPLAFEQPSRIFQG